MAYEGHGKRFGNSGANSAYGGTSLGGSGISQGDEQARNPFGVQNWGGSGGGLGGRGGGGIPLPGGGGQTYINAAGVPGDTALDVAGAYGATPGLGPTGAGVLSTSPLSQWLNPRTIAALGLQGWGAVNSLRQPAGMEGLEELFDLAMGRARASEPLFQQLLKLTTSQMPDYTRG